MRKARKLPLYWLMVGLIAATFSAPPLVSLFVACSKSDDNYLPDGPDGGITPVDGASKAQTMVGRIQATIAQALSQAGPGPYSATVVKGVSGTATITGKVNKLDLSSSSCVGSSTDTVISSIVFDNYQASDGDAEITLTGSMSYKHYRRSQTCSYGSSASCVRTMSTLSPLQASVVHEAAGEAHGIQDTVTFSVHASDSDSSSCPSCSGTLTASSGETYEF